MAYTFDAFVLFLKGRISFPALRWVLRTRPVGVCGRYGFEIIGRKTARNPMGK
jgi:hypothetical protein